MELKSNLMELAGGKFDSVSQRVAQEGRNMRAVSTFFQNTRGELERFALGLQKAVAFLRTQHQPSYVADTWSAALGSSVKGIDDLSHAMLGKAQDLTFRIVEPFEIFIGHYEQSSKNFIHDGTKILESLALQRAKLKKARDNWVAAERKPDDSAADEYRSQVDILNAFIGEHEPQYRSKILFLVQNEENRIDFERKLFAKYMEIVEDIATSMLNTGTAVKKVLADVKPIADVESDSPSLSKLPLFDKAIYEADIPLTPIQPQRKHSDASESAQGAKACSISSVESVVSELDGELAANIVISPDDEAFMKSAFFKLLEGKLAEPAEKKKMSELSQYSDGRKKFAALLEGLTHNFNVPDYQAFRTLGEIVNDMLTNFSLYNDSNISHLCSILSASALVTSFAEGGERDRPHYLRDIVSANGIWRSKERWLSIVQHRIDTSISQMQTRLNTPPNSSDKPRGLVKWIFSAGAKWIGRKGKGPDPEKEAKDEANKKAVVYSELCSAAVELALMHVGGDVGRDILIHFALTYNIEQENLFQLLTEHESAQSLQRESEGTAGEEEERKERREKRVKKYGGSPNNALMCRAIKHITDKKVLCNIVLASKEWNHLFRLRACKQILSAAPKEGKYAVWKSILTTQGLDKLYDKLKKESLIDFKNSRKQVDDVIRLDVSRSFHLYDASDQESIMNVLRCYAVFNTEIEYCQGMNFLAGFYYLIYRNEGTAFMMLCTMIANFDLAKLFKRDVPMLRALFYQMNRLIALYLPRLHVHLFEEGLNASYFCSPWFLTTFTSILQSCQTRCVPLLLHDVFDGLLTVSCLPSVNE